MRTLRATFRPGSPEEPPGTPLPNTLTIRLSKLPLLPLLKTVVIVGTHLVCQSVNKWCNLLRAREGFNKVIHDFCASFWFKDVEHSFPIFVDIFDGGGLPCSRGSGHQPQVLGLPSARSARYFCINYPDFIPGFTHCIPGYILHGSLSSVALPAVEIAL